MAEGRYRKVTQIGEGSYGVVFKGVDEQSGEEVAIKEIRLRDLDQGVPGTTLREISLLKHLQHPNIVPLLSVLSSSHKLSLIFPYLPYDLSHFLDLHGPLPPSQVRDIMQQTLTGLLFCHTHRVMHRDIKPQNVLIDEYGHVQLADFGLARAIGIPVTSYTHEVMTLWYKAPEIMLGAREYSMPADVWSAGCLLAEMVENRPLFPGDSEIDQLFRIFKTLGTPTELSYPGVTQLRDFSSMFPRWTRGDLGSKVKDLDAIGLDLLYRMLTIDPTQRVTAREALRHPYFTQRAEGHLWD